LDIHTQANVKNQNVGDALFGIVKNSMLPVYKEELVPPSVKSPPNSELVARALPLSRVSWKANSGDVNRPLFVRDCQKGVDFVVASVENASPIRPDAGAAKTFWANTVAATAKNKEK
jgi:hypothetical protein